MTQLDIVHSCHGGLEHIKRGELELTQNRVYKNTTCSGLAQNFYLKLRVKNSVFTPKGC